MKNNLIFSCLMLVLVILLIITTGKTMNYFSNSTFSRYVGSSNTTVNIDYAIPIFSDTISSIDIPLEDMEPGDSKGSGEAGTRSYSFSVLNYNDLNEISEVSLSYNIKIESTNYLPLTYELLKETSPGVYENSLLSNGISTNFILPHSIATSNNYKLVINWNSDNNYYKYANLIEVVTITIDAEQKMS